MGPPGFYVLDRSPSTTCSHCPLKRSVPPERHGVWRSATAATWRPGRLSINECPLQAPRRFSVAASSCARYGREVHGKSVPDSNQNAASARDGVRGLLRIDAYLAPIIPEAAQLDTEAEIAPELTGPLAVFHEIAVNHSLEGGVAS